MRCIVSVRSVLQYVEKKIKETTNQPSFTWKCLFERSVYISVCLFVCVCVCVCVCLCVCLCVWGWIVRNKSWRNRRSWSDSWRNRDRWRWNVRRRDARRWSREKFVDHHLVTLLLLPTPTSVAGGEFSPTFVCLSVCLFFHTICQNRCS